MPSFGLFKGSKGDKASNTDKPEGASTKTSGNGSGSNRARAPSVDVHHGMMGGFPSSASADRNAQAPAGAGLPHGEQGNEKGKGSSFGPGRKELDSAFDKSANVKKFNAMIKQNAERDGAAGQSHPPPSGSARHRQRPSISSLSGVQISGPVPGSMVRGAYPPRAGSSGIMAGPQSGQQRGLQRTQSFDGISSASSLLPMLSAGPSLSASFSLSLNTANDSKGPVGGMGDEEYEQIAPSPADTVTMTSMIPRSASATGYHSGSLIGYSSPQQQQQQQQQQHFQQNRQPHGQQQPHMRTLSMRSDNVSYMNGGIEQQPSSAPYAPAQTFYYQQQHGSQPAFSQPGGFPPGAPRLATRTSSFSSMTGVPGSGIGPPGGVAAPIKRVPSSYGSSYSATNSPGRPMLPSSNSGPATLVSSALPYVNPKFGAREPDSPANNGNSMMSMQMQAPQAHAPHPQHVQSFSRAPAPPPAMASAPMAVMGTGSTLQQQIDSQQHSLQREDQTSSPQQWPQPTSPPPSTSSVMSRGKFVMSPEPSPKMEYVDLRGGGGNTSRGQRSHSVADSFSSSMHTLPVSVSAPPNGAGSFAENQQQQPRDSIATDDGTESIANASMLSDASAAIDRGKRLLAALGFGGGDDAAEGSETEGKDQSDKDVSFQNFISSGSF